MTCAELAEQHLHAARLLLAAAEAGRLEPSSMVKAHALVACAAQLGRIADALERGAKAQEPSPAPWESVDARVAAEILTLARGRARERADVVAWLRTEADAGDGIRRLADAIARGEHRWQAAESPKDPT